MIKHRSIFIGCFLFFLILCMMHYFSQRPLWLDEISVLKNIESLNYGQILGPLSDNQAFPRFYLIAVKSVSQIFNYNTLSLRILPLIFMIAAFFIWADIYRMEFSSPLCYLLVLASFAGSYYMVYYAAELKPYSADVFVAGLFCLFLLNQKKFEHGINSGLMLFALILPFTMLFSYAGFFFFWIVAYNFVHIQRINKRVLWLLYLYIFCSFIILCCIYLSDLVFSFKQTDLIAYWNSYFLSTESFYDFTKSFTEGVRRLSVWWFGDTKVFRRAAVFVIPLFLFSTIYYGIKDIRLRRFRIENISSITLILFIELVFLGIIKKYPFTGERITLFFAPLIFCMIVKAIGKLADRKRLYMGLATLYALFLILCVVNTFLKYYGLYT